MVKFKKSIAVVAACLLMSSNVNAIIQNYFFRNCSDLALDIYDAYVDQGYSSSYANNVAQQAYDGCMAMPGNDDNELDTVNIK